MSGMLAIWTDIEPAAEADFNDWYENEHLAERTGIQGFRNGRRFRASSGKPCYLALYETDSPDVLYSPSYHARMDDPTPWTQRIIPNFRHTIRMTYAVRERLGQGGAGVVASIRFMPQLKRKDELMSWLSENALPHTLQQSGVIGTWLLEPHVTQGSDDTDTMGEGKLRVGWDTSEPWAVIVEATSLEAARAVQQRILPRSALRDHGAVGAMKVGMYRLNFSLGTFAFD